MNNAPLLLLANRPGSALEEVRNEDMVVAAAGSKTPFRVETY